MIMAGQGFDSELLNLANRMLAPFQREFGHRLDVDLLLNNRAYALAVLEKAQTSKEERLRAYALMAQERLLGPRTGPGPLPGRGGSEVEGEPSVLPQEEDAEAERLRAQVLSRYRSGLR